jgi:hypothetical protein
VSRLDHRHLNEVVAGLTTAENLLYWISLALLPAFGAALHRVELRETRSSGAILTEAEIQTLALQTPPPIVA